MGTYDFKGNVFSFILIFMKNEKLGMYVGEIISENRDRWPSGERQYAWREGGNITGREGRFHYLIPKEHWPFPTKMESDCPTVETTQKMSTWPSLSSQLRSGIKIEVYKQYYFKLGYNSSRLNVIIWNASRNFCHFEETRVVPLTECTWAGMRTSVRRVDAGPRPTGEK